MSLTPPASASVVAELRQAPDWTEETRAYFRGMVGPTWNDLFAVLASSSQYADREAAARWRRLLSHLPPTGVAPGSEWRFDQVAKLIAFDGG